MGARSAGARRPARCPCGLGPSYDACCGRYLTGRAAGQAAPTAELLMRSRYTAFARGDTAYLRATWHPATRPPLLVLDPAQRWTRLEVLRVTGGGLLEPAATVEFRAHWSAAGSRGVLHENSRFERVDGRWAYRGPAAEG